MPLYEVAVVTTVENREHLLLAPTVIFAKDNGQARERCLLWHGTAINNASHALCIEASCSDAQQRRKDDADTNLEVLVRPFC